MRTDIERPKNLPATREIDNIAKAAKEDAGFETLLKFIKGKYFINKVEVALGTRYVAHTTQWTKAWIKFADGGVVDQRMGKVADGFALSPRESLGDTDESKWELDRDGKPKDPWSPQYLLPMESLENGDVVVFTTPSVGGKRAVADLCQAYTRHTKKGSRALPIVGLATAEMSTKKWGSVPRPEFKIVGWNEVAADNVEVISPSVADDLDDEIPF
jgi:hypothetical protein